MISRSILQQISPLIWELPKSFSPHMRVPARIYANEVILNDIIHDKSLKQLINVASMYGIEKNALGMPDIHQGFGFPIGGVAAMSTPDGIISPGGIGYDINCGVRLLLSQFSFKNIKNHLNNLSKSLFYAIPSGVGQNGRIKLSNDELEEVLFYGVKWMIKRGYVTQNDIENIESFGCFEDADPFYISPIAKKRGLDQLGTLGAGNHFIEVDVVEEIYNKRACEAYKLWEQQIVIMIHTGSRGLGHQIATDYIKLMNVSMPKYYPQFQGHDKQLAGVPFSSNEGIRYFKSMMCAANYAWCNRQIITDLIRKTWNKTMGESSLELLYDVSHNIAKKEVYTLNGEKKQLLVHRKGAIRSFGPGNLEIPLHYRHIGQPIFIPGNMGTHSYVLSGTQLAMEESFGSCCHGAGRRMSRSAAKKKTNGYTISNQLLNQGIIIKTKSLNELAEEAPFAYKNIDNIVEIIDQIGLAKKVARLRPLIVIKG